MATQHRTVARTIDLGAGRLSQHIGPLAIALGKALSAAGSGRRRLGPLDADPADNYVTRPRTAQAIADALLLPANITIISGHGGSSAGAWALCPSRSDPVTLGNIRECLAGKKIPTDLLIVDACWADHVADCWAPLLPAHALVLSAVDKVGLPEATRWIATLFLCLAAHTGESELSRDQYLSAIAETRRNLDSNAAMGRSVTISGQFTLPGDLS